MNATSEINERLSQIKAKMEELEKELEALFEEQEELEGAKYTIERYLGDRELTPPRNEKTKSLSKQQTIVYNAVPIGKEDRLPPSEIARACRGLSADYVRTTVRRLLEDNWIKTENGQYWSDL